MTRSSGSFLEVKVEDKVEVMTSSLDLNLSLNLLRFDCSVPVRPGCFQPGSGPELPCRSVA